MSEEKQYLDLVRDVLENGDLEKGRNGDTLAVFGRMMRFSLKDGKIPILTTKHVAWKTCFRELMWFIRGNTDNKELQEQGVHIWDANATREFLDSRGLTEYPEGILGPIYGYQWRNFGAPYSSSQSNRPDNAWGITDSIDLEDPPLRVDQLQQIIDALSDPTQRYSRRLIMTAWNPAQIEQMALPPCHVLAQFSVKGNRLSCALYQRSGDVGLGVPFNIASYSFLTHLLAHHCGLEAGEFVHFLGDAHIYVDHEAGLREQLEREPLDFPRIRIVSKKERIDDYELEDLEFLEEYRHHPKIVLPLIA
jgi:thymidylate synthase